MPERPRPQIDIETARPMGNVGRFTRRKVGPAKVFLAFLLAVAITAAAFGVLSVVLWAVASFFH